MNYVCNIRFHQPTPAYVRPCQRARTHALTSTRPQCSRKQKCPLNSLGARNTTKLIMHTKSLYCLFYFGVAGVCCRRRCCCCVHILSLRRIRRIVEHSQFVSSICAAYMRYVNLFAKFPVSCRLRTIHTRTHTHRRMAYAAPKLSAGKKWDMI